MGRVVMLKDITRDGKVDGDAVGRALSQGKVIKHGNSIGADAKKSTYSNEDVCQMLGIKEDE